MGSPVLPSHGKGIGSITSLVDGRLKLQRDFIHAGQIGWPRIQIIGGVVRLGCGATGRNGRHRDEDLFREAFRRDAVLDDNPLSRNQRGAGAVRVIGGTGRPPLRSAPVLASVGVGWTMARICH
jgi:hypothetical protein